MKKVLIASGVAVLAFAMIAGAQGTVFSTNLTVGSTGTDVVALQTWLNANGYNIPAITSGVAAPGYFGSQTKAAVQKYQAAKGIPATGFVGPLTRAALNAGGGVTPGTTVVCPVGYTCTPLPGTTNTPVTGISTPGAEGSITVTTNNAGLVSTVYEGETMRPVYGFNVEAKSSDMLVQRVKVNLGTNSAIYNKGYSKLYVTEGSNVLASTDLTSSTVVKEGTTYYITVSGLNLVVPKDSKKQIVLKADVRPSIDTTDRTTLGSISITIPANGVRAVDGAGIDQYGPSSALTGRTTTFSAELAETATLKISSNSLTPKKAEVIATAGASENEMDKLTVLVFDVKAEKDDVKITDMNIGVVKSGNGAATASTTAYLFEGSTEIDSASVSGGQAIFADFDQVIPRDVTKTYTVKVDVRGADATVAYFTGSASSTGTTAENSKGDSITESGSATGYAIGVRNVGPEITLTSKSLTTDGAPQGGTTSNLSTSTLTASFVLHIKAVGGDVMFGTQSSTTPAFASSTSGITLYVGGVSNTAQSSVSTTTEYIFPSICSTTNLTNSCTLSEGNEMDVTVNYTIKGRTSVGAALTSGNYSVGLAAVNWNNGTAQSTSFMAGETDWITNSRPFP